MAITCLAFSTICSWLFVISQEVITVEGEVDNLTSLTIGWGLLSTLVAVGIFGVVAVVDVDDDGLSIIGLATVTVDFEASATDVPPETIIPRIIMLIKYKNYKKIVN